MFYLNDMVLELDDGAAMRKTSDGYLTATPRVARTGIQLYRGSELGKPEKGIVKIYRDEAEVFNKDSLASYAGKPITDDHPPVFVDAKNWKKYGKGAHGNDILRDGEFIRVPLVLMDAGLVDKVEKGKVQLSVGYGCEIDWTPGTAPDGAAYDGRQIGIRVNHTAVVDAARGGSKLSLGDGLEANLPLYDSEGKRRDYQPETKDTTMNLKTMIVDGITCEMTDTAVQVVQRALDAAKNNFEAFKKKSEEEEKKAKDALDAANAKVAELTTKAQSQDAEIVTLKKQVEDSALTPAKLDQLVKDRAAVADKAKTVLPEVIVDGKSVDEIMKQVVDAKIGAAAKDWDAKMVKVSFDTLTANAQVADAGAVHLQNTVRAFSQPPANQLADSAKRYDKYDADISKAWQTPAGAA